MYFAPGQGCVEDYSKSVYGIDALIVQVEIGFVHKKRSSIAEVLVVQVPTWSTESTLLAGDMPTGHLIWPVQVWCATHAHDVS